MRTSYSACQMYLNCAYSYFLHYFRKLRPIEDKSSFVFGDCIDAGLNHLLTTRDLKGALRAFNKRWYKRAYAGNLKYAKSDLDEHLIEGMKFKNDKLKNWVAVRRRGEILIKEFNAQIMPRIKEVIKVQIDEVMYNAHGDELVIKTDFICRWEDDRIILFDNKTSSVKYTEDSVRTSPQLAIYNVALAEEYKIDACGYIVIPKKTLKIKKPQVDIKVIIDTINPETEAQTFKDFEETLVGIKTAQFPQKTENCITKYGPCVYLAYCHEGKMQGLKEKEDKNDYNKS